MCSAWGQDRKENRWASSSSSSSSFKLQDPSVPGGYSSWLSDDNHCCLSSHRRLLKWPAGQDGKLFLQNSNIHCSLCEHVTSKHQYERGDTLLIRWRHKQSPPVLDDSDFTHTHTQHTYTHTHFTHIKTCTHTIFWVFRFFLGFFCHAFCIVRVSGLHWNFTWWSTAASCFLGGQI